MSMRYCHVMLFFVLFYVFSGTTVRAADVLLTEDGKPLAVIVLPDAPGDAEAFAASELQSYLEKITGAMLPVKPESELGGDEAFISVGRTRLSADARERLAGELPDSFIVEGVGNGILLAGAGGSGRSPGTLFAVYDFLERELGCRWLGPGELWEHVPESAALSVSPVNRLEKPAFAMRMDPSLDWAWKHKANMVGRRLQWPFEWMREASRNDERQPFDTPGWYTRHSIRSLLPVTGRGADPELVTSMLNEHFDWFALQEDGSRSINWFCHSSPEVIELIAGRLSEMFRERPHKLFLELSEGTGLWRGACRCAECVALDELGGDDALSSRRGRHTYRWLTWVNNVAKLLEKSDPGKGLVAVAVSSFQQPPAPGLVRSADNVVIRYKTWHGCRMHGFEHADKEGVAIGRMPEMVLHEDTRRWIEGWREITPAGMVLTECLGGDAMDRISFAQPRRFVNDLRYLHRNGFIGYYSFVGPTPNLGMSMLNRYALLKAMWEPGLDVDELVRDFCDHAFHEASDPMQRFIEVVQSGAADGACSHVLSVTWARPDVIAAARRHLDEAHEAAADNDVVQKRLVPWEVQFQYASLAGPAWVKYYGAVASGHFGIEDDPDLLQEAISEGRAAMKYISAMQEKHRDHPESAFLRGLGGRIRGNVREGGTWERRLERIGQ